MSGQKFCQLLAILGCACCIAGSWFYFSNESLMSGPFASTFLAQNTYFGPTHKIPGDPQLVRIEIIIRDSPAKEGVQIENAEFDHQIIPLKPRDILGYRGTGSFQLPPGHYKLKWTVRRDKVVWPRTFTREEEVTIDEKDLWVQISIVGEDASIL